MKFDKERSSRRKPSESGFWLIIRKQQRNDGYYPPLVLRQTLKQREMGILGKSLVDNSSGVQNIYDLISFRKGPWLTST
jgi:hypothetical protein